MINVKNVEQANVAVNEARLRLANAARDGVLSELSNSVNAVAHAEGVAEAHYIKERLEGHGESEAIIALELAGRMSHGADDSWSGRGNDVQRAKHDGFREAAQRIIQKARYQMERENEALEV